jgi:putative component of membrane protein insertase Oxa1/YidC/SpoIIIJ protein YidD
VLSSKAFGAATPQSSQRCGQIKGETMRQLIEVVRTIVRLVKCGPFPRIGYWSDRVTGREMIYDEHTKAAWGAEECGTEK